MNNIRLAAKIAARNAANQTALEVAPRIIEALAEFAGQPLKTKQGDKTAKLEKALTALDLPNQFGNDGNRLQVIVKVDTYWLRAEVWCSRSTGQGSASEHVTVTLGDMDGRTLKSVCAVPSPVAHRTDFTVAEIAQARKDVEVMRDALRAAEFKLAGFGEHDCN